MSDDQTPPERFGIIEDESNEQYHASESTSHSKLEVLGDPDRGPARYKGQFILKNIPRQAPTEALDFGAAFDSMLLEKKEIHTVEPETYPAPASDKKDAPIIQKKWNNNATFCRDWYAAQVKKVVLTPGQIRLMEAMRAALPGNPDAEALLSQGKPQMTFRLKFRWFNVQVRLDKWHPNGLELSTGKITAPVIADMKTAEDEDQFMSNRKNFGYDRQDALYRRVVREVLADIAQVAIEKIPLPEFIFVVGFKSPPVDWKVFKLTDDDYKEAAKEVEDDLRYLHKCYAAGDWPGSLRGINLLPPLWRKAKKEIW